MSTYTKQFLSGSSISAPQILISAITSGSANPIHTNTSGSIDEVYLYAYNDSTSSLTLSLLWGGTSEPKDVVRATIAAQGGRALIVDGKIIQNGATISAYASVANWI